MGILDEGVPKFYPVNSFNAILKSCSNKFEWILIYIYIYIMFAYTCTSHDSK